MKLDASIAAIVTGGASGLGAATARALAACGVRVTIFDMDEGGAALAGEISGSFARVDVCSDESVAEGFAAARAAHGPERILVNCAGIAPAAKLVSSKGRHPSALYQKVIEVNLVGTFRCCAFAAEGMRGLEPGDTGERGVIVNTASIAGYEGQTGQVAYAASKAAVIGMTLPMARELSASAIRVCAIAPGLFVTPMVGGMPSEVQDSLYRQVPFPKRGGAPAEFAQLVRSLLENAYINGEVVRLDGAMRMSAT